MHLWLGPDFFVHLSSMHVACLFCFSFLWKESLFDCVFSSKREKQVTTLTSPEVVKFRKVLCFSSKREGQVTPAKNCDSQESFASCNLIVGWKQLGRLAGLRKWCLHETVRHAELHNTLMFAHIGTKNMLQLQTDSSNKSWSHSCKSRRKCNIWQGKTRQGQWFRPHFASSNFQWNSQKWPDDHQHHIFQETATATRVKCHASFWRF